MENSHGLIGRSSSSASSHAIAWFGQDVLTSKEAPVSHDGQRRPRRDAGANEEPDPGKKVVAVDDFLDVKLELAPATTWPEGPSAYAPRAAREYYRVVVPRDSEAEVTFSVSPFCADSLRSNDGHLQRYDDQTFDELQRSGNMEVSGGEGRSGEVTFRGLRPGSTYLVCENSGAQDMLAAPSADTANAGYVFDYGSLDRNIQKNDTLVTQYRGRVEFSDAQGSFYGVEEGRWLVPGQYGLLKVDGNSYVTYVPRADPAVIGKVDVFTYRLLDPKAGDDLAHVFVRIGSDQADIEWNPDQPYDDARKVDVWSPDSAATIEVLRDTTTVVQESAISYRWQVDEAGRVSGTPKGSRTFSIADQSEAALTIDITAEALPELAKSIEIEFVKVVGRLEKLLMSTYVHGDRHPMTVADGNIRMTFEDLEPGTYRLDVANQRDVATPGSLDVDLTFLYESYSAGSTHPATGDLIAGSDADTPDLAIIHDGSEFFVPGADGAQLRGDFGLLTIEADGDYVYLPDNDLANIGKFDSFRYQLHHPDGTVEDERLTIAIIDDPALSLDDLLDGEHTAMDMAGAHEAGREGQNSTLDAMDPAASATVMDPLAYLAAAPDDQQPAATSII